VEISNPSARWQKIEEVFYAALDVAPEARPDFLRQACGSNLELLQEVQSLIDSSEKTVGGFVRQAVLQVARQQTAALERSGKRVGAYQLVRVIGEGGMGTVYLATRADETYRQQVAIKLMHPGFGPSQGMLLRFSAERQILANLNHPNIARLLDGGMTGDGVPYLVMEYVDGIPIDAYCRQNQLSIPDRLQLFRAVCSAVEYAHKHLVIHRDIKPANILVTAEGVPKLLDFGIAKLLDPGLGDLNVTRNSERFLTPEHASPEQIRGESVMTTTDVYALGVLLYELLAGRLPFQMAAKSPLEVAQIICEQTPEPPSRVVASSDSWKHAPETSRKLKGDLDHIVLMAMRKEPTRRYSSVASLSRDVEAYLNGYSVQARSDTWGYRSGKFIRRHKVAVPMAVLAVLALIGFSIGMGWLARRAERQRQIAERQRLASQKEADFLGSIFVAATPRGGLGRNISARDLLDESAQRIDSELSATPEAQANAFYNLGMAYRHLGLMDEAEPLLFRSYELRQQLFGQQNIDVAKSAVAIAENYRLSGQYSKAEPFFRHALQVAQKAPGDNATVIADILHKFGFCLFMDSQDAEAESLFKQSLTLLPDPEGSDAAFIRSGLALVLDREGDYVGAWQLGSKALATLERLNSPDVGSAQNNKNEFLRDMGNLRQAEIAQRQTVELWRRVAGSHVDIAWPLSNLGTIFLLEGQTSKAEPLMREALNVRQKTLGPKNPLIAISLDEWGRVLQAKADYPGAETSFRQSLDMLYGTAGSENWMVEQALSDFSKLQLDRADYASAESYADRAMEMSRKLGREESPQVAESLSEIALARELRGDAASAEPMLRSALEIRQHLLPPRYPAIVAAETRLGEALTAEGKAAVAEPILREAVDSAHHGPFALLDWQVGEAESALGVCLAKLGERTEAAKLLSGSHAALASYPQHSLQQWILKLRTSAQL
jgi:eukaryotic-like serine/threonine-protein kinase